MLYAIDTIKLTIPKQIDDKFVCWGGELFFYRGKYFRIGSFGNMAIKQYDNKTNIYGSLSKFSNGGDNSENIDFPTLRGAIQEISRKLDFDPQTAKIQRLDFGTNIPVATNPDSYIALFGNLQGFDKTLYPNGIMYQSKETAHRKIIVIYNKSKESKLKTNVLRYELRFFQNLNIRKCLNVDVLSDLKNIQTFQKLQQIGNGYFCKIQTNNNVLFMDNAKIKTSRQAMDFFAYAYIQQNKIDVGTLGLQRVEKCRLIKKTEMLQKNFGNQHQNKLHGELIKKLNIEN